MYFVLFFAGKIQQKKHKVCSVRRFYFRIDVERTLESQNGLESLAQKSDQEVL